ncbi:hypothetical protein Calag_0653 [Caldisphaera lagunensis DSM 15908]|uniref:Uncharacterized protein n=1 Tax=Caldisphaera lagunensis (strain DSM 15908 / JCM 11604 / ANMR 0165 / IC-154) TaxID=1056495 RepID=L0AAF1_CALLD|nr:hypothetical protein [Caldisphaera lagunensis]AFZ70404.1 hypothetical protein Calag_0653 [Caldisphaera lagunensis DSM 15908]
MKNENNNNINNKKEAFDLEEKLYMEWYMIWMETPFHGAPGG